MEHQLATKSTQKEQSEKPAFSSTLQQSSSNQATAHPLLRLQRAVGNQAVQRLLNPGKIQAKLAVGQPGDVYKQEADHMVQQVVTSPPPHALQRSAANSTNTNQSSTASTTVPPLQQKGRGQSPQSDTLSQNQSPLQEAPHQKENTTGLPDTLKTGVEHLSGLQMDDVHVHYNSSKPAQVQALAYTQGTEIHVGPGQDRNLPHEAWHVVQQKEGRVTPTLQTMGVAINNDHALELEADMLGAKAAHGEQGNEVWVHPGVGKKVSALLQRALDQDQIDALTARARELHNRIEQIRGRLPEVIRNNVGTDRLIEPIRQVTNDARHRADAVDYDSLNQMLDRAEQAINGLDQVVAANQANFDAISRTYNAVPAANRNALFRDLNAKFVNIGQSIEKGKTIVSQVNDLKRAMEVALIPENQEMKDIRARNAQEAMDRVAMIVQAGLAVVGTLKSLYVSEFDTPEDQFGGACSLKMAASTGKAQWLNEWEFHIHATVQRAALAPHAVTGFIITRAHIKPSAGARELGVSIQITNAVLLTQVQNDNQRKIIQWSQTPAGENILKKSKR